MTAVTAYLMSSLSWFITNIIIIIIININIIITWVRRQERVRYDSCDSLHDSLCDSLVTAYLGQAPGAGRPARGRGHDHRVGPEE